MNFETLLPRVSAATLIRGLGRIHLNCFEIGYSKFNKNKPAWWYSCSLSPIQLGEAPWLPGLGLAKPECDGKMSVELPENSLSLAGWPARGSLPADSRLTEQARLWHKRAPFAGLPRRAGTERLPHSWPGSRDERMPQGQMDGVSEKQ